MNRLRAKELFSVYLEGEIEAQDRRALEEYLDGDPETRAELESFRRTLESLAQLRKPVTPPSEFSRQVEGRIRKRSRGRFFGHRVLNRWPFEWFSFLIILALLTLYVLLVLESHQGPTPGAQGDATRSRPAATAPRR